MRRIEADVLVVGSGIAGLTAALRLSEDARVLLLTKKDRAEANTNYAQGGIAAAFAPEDSPELHRRDTLLAGAGLCHADAVEELVREGPDRVRDLIEWGVEFSREEGDLALAREGGHSRRRILHSADLTGQEIEGSLLSAVAESPRARLLEDHFVWSLTTGPDPSSSRPRCTGAVVLDAEDGEWFHVASRAVLLAAGGCGRLYRHTTNPAIATGDGIAIGYEAGAAVGNLEFVQFHPTALYPAGSQAFLISEAVRGEGAVLRGRDGSQFMEEYHPDGSLAPRDVVARAIHAELTRSGEPHVWLDLSSLPAGGVRERFPHIRRRCAEQGVEIPEDPIPVVPAAHYQCGGVLTDRDGRTTLPGLFAAGEVACTGVHGANRLASNSLLEAVVYASRASRRVKEELPGIALSGRNERARPEIGRPGRSAEAVERQVRELMWRDVGIVRSDRGLRRARKELSRIAGRPVARAAEDPEGLMRAREVEFMRRVAALVVRSALRRKESRGLHYTESYPHRNSEDFLRDTVLVP